MIDEQFLATVPRYGIGGLVGKFFKNVKKAIKKVAPVVGGGIGFMIGGAAGAGIGAGIGGLIAGQKPEQALQTAMLGYGIGSVAGTWGPFKDMAGQGVFGGKMAWNPSDKGNVLKMMGFGGGYGDAPVKISKHQTQINTLLDKKAALDPNIAKDADLITQIDKKINALEIADLIDTKKDMGTLGKALVGTSLASIPLTYMDALQQQKDMANVDPAALNKFYYSDPQQFQVANVAAAPYYYPELQTDFGVNVEDLPTEFIRGSAEGGIIQLADGTTKHFPRKNGQIDGPGTGTSDDIPAMLSDGEFVFTAEAVRNAGGGNRREGAKRMYQVMKNLENNGTLSNQSRGIA